MSRARVRERPGLYVGDSPNLLSILETMLGGYYAALGYHDVHEPGPQLTQGHFGVWLRWRTNWSLSCGWARAIEEHSKSGSALRRFFTFADEYAKLVPRIRERFEIVRYAPTPLHFVRTRARRCIDDSWIMMRPDGSHHTSLRQAKQLAERYVPRGLAWRSA